jgi:hypothetical protein
MGYLFQVCVIVPVSVCTDLNSYLFFSHAVSVLIKSVLVSRMGDQYSVISAEQAICCSLAILYYNLELSRIWKARKYVEIEIVLPFVKF